MGRNGDRRSAKLRTGERAQKRELTMLQLEHLPVLVNKCRLGAISMKDQRNASHQLTFDFAEIDMSMYTHITNAIVSEFGLEMAGPKIDSFDLVSQDFCQGKDIVGLEWDTWSGYTVVAKSKSAEALTREIALYISTHFDP